METLELRGVPRYVKISEKLRREIAGGVLKPGDRLPSFAQSRAELGISQATWEKIHSTLELEGLIVREPGRGVFVAQPASLRERRTRTHCIGLVGYGFREAGSSTYWAQVLSGVYEAAERAGHSVVLLPVEEKSGWEQADGILTYGWSPAESRARATESIPNVYLFSQAEGLPSVCADEAAAVQELTTYLLSLGHRRIAYLHGSGLDETSPRISGYLSALRAGGVVPRKGWRRTLSGTPGYGAEFIQSGQASMAHWLTRGWDKTGCTAILAHNDETAVGVMEAMVEAGVRVPQEVSVVGFDGLDIGAYYSPRLTTMQLPLREIGIQATELLLQIIEGERNQSSFFEHRVLPCILKLRESCARRK